VDGRWIVYDETTGTNPPVLETDPHGNVYVVKQKYDAPPDATLMIFRPEDGFAVPQTFAIPNGNSGKYALLYDWRRSQLYYFSHQGRFYRIALDGSVTLDQLLITSGPNAGPQYPYLAMDEDGVVYAAWTTQRHDAYLYWSIGAARSRDAGTSWERFDGTPLPTPIVCDDTGPGQAIQLPDELASHTWLWNLSAKNKKVHFAYLAQTAMPRQTYVRYDAATGAEEARVAPVFGGGSTALFSLDGFPASDPGMPNRLFWTSASQSGSPRLAILQTTDNGVSWLDYAQGGDPALAPYAVGGARFLSEDGDLLGTFTDVVEGQPVKVWFLRASTRTESDPVGCL
jgi:hypothetical protein